MKINHNISSLNTYKQLNIANQKMSKSLERLSSGLRINRASDDAAGLAISRKMHSQIRGLEKAERNSLDAISMIQIGEGALAEIHSILQRMRELSVQAANGSNGAEDRAQIQSEVNQLCNEINRIGGATEFNTKHILNGNAQDTKASVMATNRLTVPMTITNGLNDTLRITVDGETVDAVITAGMYSTEEDVASAVESAINTATTVADDVSVTLGIGLDENKLIIESTLAGSASQVEVGTHPTQDARAQLAMQTVIEKTAYDQGEGPLEFLIQVGANANQVLEFSVDVVSTEDLGLTGTGTIFSANANVMSGASSTEDLFAIDYSLPENVEEAISIIDDAIGIVSSQRAKLGAIQNRLQTTVDNMGTSTENLTAALSRIEDADMAIEMASFTQNNVLLQAAQAMLAQANQMPQGVLQLLR